jgi:hypothetical protein
MPDIKLTPDEYVAALPDDRREAIAAVRETILANLPEGYEEGIQYGMLGYYIPLERYPETYNGQPLSVAALANQKNYMSLYLNCVYSDGGEKDWFERRWAETGKKLDMGKSCVRFKKLEDLPLDVVGEAIARVQPEEYIATYERVRGIGG